jgi:hypothetical protein
MTKSVALLEQAKEQLSVLGWSPSNELAVQLVDAAAMAAARAEDIGTVKLVHDQVKSIGTLFESQRATAIQCNLLVAQRLRIERQMGVWLAEHIQHQGGRPAGKAPRTILPDSISGDESSQWQKLAQIGEDDFEDWLDNNMGNPKELTTAGALRLYSMYVKPELVKIPMGEAFRLTVKHLRRARQEMQYAQAQPIPWGFWSNASFNMAIESIEKIIVRTKEEQENA